ncbi:MAG: NAD-dependent dehydratase [Candidatus Omnitrophica bacterium CG11_big_fil_rev_8_21_14_0_20_45_26]|uniref:NAD-dependent dehydratase n=1 Tax=Candidatus Abzuiibacterium crystallinum TaxID=1974748 RepID=A0A2H0LLD1_9BACT|nr:MAG: NAD-dependent dehydratase [Candidatus Omnitrophica bacterium CG11_big_fil_rev_8_21_14_0_20_45_26]PIW64481.1 MAG: NAD-dependent dehydratase [Candidatus Omnitrophica bacterium CG12_big_fil_rev_8_21_14_0_65_45_16]
MSDVLVTGGSGFIGSHLVRALVKRGERVRVFDNEFRGSEANLVSVRSEIDWVEGDIRDAKSVHKAMSGIQTVFHLAFINGTEYFYSQPKLVLEVGIKGTLNTIEAAQANGVKKFIYASSSEVYQNAAVIPTPENVPAIIPDVKNPRYSYGGGKLMGELLTLHYLPKGETQRLIFRPHNIYGPAMGWEHVIPQFLENIFKASEAFQKKEIILQIQGNGQETRAFCYIDDAIEGILTVADKGTDGEIYHVGKDEEISIIQLIEAIEKCLKIKIQIKIGELTPGSTPRRSPCIDKLKTMGYCPKVSLTNGLMKTIEWYQRALTEKLCHK